MLPPWRLVDRSRSGGRSLAKADVRPARISMCRSADDAGCTVSIAGGARTVYCSSEAGRRGELCYDHAGLSRAGSRTRP
jgi:hypothetical protein